MSIPEHQRSGHGQKPMNNDITICIVGLGLMGGSLALALRQALRQAQDDALRQAQDDALRQAQGPGGVPQGYSVKPVEPQGAALRQAQDDALRQAQGPGGVPQGYSVKAHEPQARGGERRGGLVELPVEPLVEPLRASMQGRSALIIGVGRHPETLQAAQAEGAIDAWTTDLAEGVAAADIIVLATPVRTILRLLPEVGKYARPGALILDLGSTKAQICAAMADLPAGLQPVGGHPMCGKETAGFAAAEAGLFRGHPFVLCPLPRTAPDALDLAKHLAQATAARTIILDPTIHDRAVAAISHLPYTVAVTLVNAVEMSGDPLAWSLAASGFRDTSRLAASDVDMMLDILLSNRDAVLDWLDAFAGQLATLRAALDAGDEPALRAQLVAAQACRAGKVSVT